jgi:hypothetical protein
MNWDIFAEVANIVKVIEKGGPGSGHHRHKGIKGHRGGSAPSKAGKFSQQTVDEALKFVRSLTATGGPGSSQQELSEEAKDFLAQTVLDKPYNVKRGIGLIKDRVDAENIPELRELKPGDPVPSFLMKQYNPYASYSKKIGVARDYAQGKMEIVTQAKVPPGRVLVDLERLPDVLTGVKVQAIVHSVKGKL